MAEEKKGFFRGLMDKITGEPEPSPTVESTSAATGEESKPGFFDRLKRGLAKTHESIVGRIDTLILGKKEIDADTLEELE
ncbi:MAG TPA: signal recognition particle-docking protein FtsY, partial [Geobacteraceae bacterium]